MPRQKYTSSKYGCRANKYKSNLDQPSRIKPALRDSDASSLFRKQRLEIELLIETQGD